MIMQTSNRDDKKFSEKGKLSLTDIYEGPNISLCTKCKCKNNNGFAVIRLRMARQFGQKFKRFNF